MGGFMKQLDKTRRVGTKTCLYNIVIALFTSLYLQSLSSENTGFWFWNKARKAFR